MILSLKYRWKLPLKSTHHVATNITSKGNLWFWEAENHVHRFALFVARRFSFVVASGFLPQNFRRWWGPLNDICHCMNVGWLVGTLRSGGTLKPCLLNSHLFELFVLKFSEDTRTFTPAHSCRNLWATWWNVHFLFVQVDVNAKELVQNYEI